MDRIRLAVSIAGAGYLALFLLMVLGARLVPARIWRISRRVIVGLVLVYPAALLGLLAGQSIWPQDRGLLAVLQVFAPYLFAPLLLIVPFALLRNTTALRIGLALCLVGFGLRFVRLAHQSAPNPDPQATQIAVLSWNLGLGTEQAQLERARPVLITRPADLVVLEEAYWRWIEADRAITALYPYRTALHWESATGLILLSAYPILEHDVPAAQATLQASADARQIVARLDINGEPLTLIATHPPSAAISFGPCLVICYDVTARNTRLEAVRALIDALLPSGEPLLVVGDFNVTPREPAYHRLSAGLQEAHHESGSGSGLTWPLPSSNESFPHIIPDPLQRFLPLIRIDHHFSNSRLIPLQSLVDCTSRDSDHCAVWSQFALKPNQQP